MSDGKTFPVMVSWREQHALPPCPRSVPWEFIAPHEEWAENNHEESLAELASRGGLSACEIVAIIEHRKWYKMTWAESVDQLTAKLDEWRDRCQTK